MKTKVLIVIALLQVGAIGYLSVKKTAPALNQEPVNLKVTVVLPSIEEKMVAIPLPPLPEKEADPFDFDIPDRRSELLNARSIDLDKNLNMVGYIGDAMMENPVMLRGIEQVIREQFANFYADFVKEANLTPDEQIELFKVMSQTMQANIRSMMQSMGENMAQMETMFAKGPPPEMVAGIKENNLQLKNELISTLGEDRFNLFDQYHREKSAAESFMRLQNRLKSEKVPLNEDQEKEVRQVLINNQPSPFNEDSYEQTTVHPSTNTDSVLNEQQQKIFQEMRQRQNRLLLLPF